jgi:hypothetical protein
MREQMDRPSTSGNLEDDILRAISGSARTDTKVSEDNRSEIVNEDRVYDISNGPRRLDTEGSYSRVIVSLSSGRTLHAHHVMLYDELKLTELRTLIDTISNQLGRSTMVLKSSGASIPM